VLTNFCGRIHLQVSKWADDIAAWVNSNKLQLVSSKIGSALVCNESPPTSAAWDDSDSVPITPLPCVRDLGIYIDGDLSIPGHTFNGQFRAALPPCVNYINFAGRFLQPRSRLWYLPLCTPAWTTATVCWSVSKRI